uniref:Uncharacterized protein n=1 Tax=Vespula pensylvanica TaxID=30213 RepID=A0A834PFU9_VESPE|nr:hypothetical protein H0235_001320 [Vespula pensylvanica]
MSVFSHLTNSYLQELSYLHHHGVVLKGFTFVYYALNSLGGNLEGNIGLRRTLLEPLPKVSLLGAGKTLERSDKSTLIVPPTSLYAQYTKKHVLNEPLRWFETRDSYYFYL